MTLPCRVENRIGLLQWTRDGFGLGDTRQLSGYPRYRLVGSDDESKLVLFGLHCYKFRNIMDGYIKFRHPFYLILTVDIKKIICLQERVCLL